MSGGMVLVDVSGKASTVMTTKGDIITNSTERIRKGVGSNSQILVCDSTDSDGNKYDYNSTSFVIACSDETTDLENMIKQVKNNDYLYNEREKMKTYVLGNGKSSMKKIDQAISSILEVN